MFCKQCSQQLNATDRKCPACGADVEAMSDCGGFYRLRHGQPETAAGAAVVDEEWQRQNEAARRAQMTHHKVMLGSFAAVLVLTVLIAVFGICVLLRLGQLERQLRELTPIVPTGPGITETVQTEPPKTEPPKTEPPKTEPPETEPPETEPPKTEPPKTEPPETEPPETEPPETEPPEAEPPKTEPSEPEPPETKPNKGETPEPTGNTTPTKK